MTYSLPYILFVAFLGFSALLFDNLNKEKDALKRYIVVCTTIIAFFIFIGFRGFILSDWIIYYDYFYSCSFNDITNYSLGQVSSIEPGYTILNLLCKAIFKNYFFFQIVCSFINLVLLLRFFNNKVENIPLALMIFFTFEGLELSTNLMRNYMAILIFLNSIEFLKQRKPIPYFLMCIFAVSFHTSALLYIPLYFFFNKSCNKWVYLSIFILCNIIFIFHVSIVANLLSIINPTGLFTDKIVAYTEVYKQSNIISIGYIERLFTGILIFLYFNKLKEVRKDNAIYINGIIAYFIMYFFFSEFQVLSKRFAILFAFGYWIIWIDLIKCFAINNNRRLFKAFILIYCIMRMYGTAVLPDFKYENILFGHSSYQERLYIHNKTFEMP